MQEQGRSLAVWSRLGSFRIKQKDWMPYALVGPALLVVLGIAVYPALTALRVSMYEMNLLRLSEAEFVILDNYLALVQDDDFRGAVLRTLRWTVTVVVFQMAVALPMALPQPSGTRRRLLMAVALPMALFLNLKFRWRGVVRTIVLLPYIVPSTVIVIIWIYMFDANFGVVNEFLVRLGLIPSYIAWLADKNLSFVVLVLAMVWWGTPFMAVMLLAALQALDPELYDAAFIDGAGAWHRFRYITLPQLMPSILVLLLLRTIWMSHHVDIIFLMTDGGPGLANYTLSIYSFILTSERFEVGSGSAVAVILAIVLLFVALIYIRNMEKSMDYLR